MTGRGEAAAAFEPAFAADEAAVPAVEGAAELKVEDEVEGLTVEAVLAVELLLAESAEGLAVAVDAEDLAAAVAVPELAAAGDAEGFAAAVAVLGLAATVAVLAFPTVAAAVVFTLAALLKFEATPSAAQTGWVTIDINPIRLRLYALNTNLVSPMTIRPLKE